MRTQIDLPLLPGLKTPLKQRQAAREWAVAHPERAAELKREWRRKNAEKNRQQKREASARHRTRNPGAAASRTKAWTLAHPERVQNQKQARRSASGRVGAVVTISYVFERDGGMCGICGSAVPLVARGAHPLAPTVDHIIPLKPAKNATHPPGEHSRRNCRLAHLRCNVARGNRYRGEPMLDLVENGQYRNPRRTA